MPNLKKWLKNYVCTSNCKGICFFVGRGRMFFHFLRSKDIALIARRSLVHLKNMEFRKNNTWEKTTQPKRRGTARAPKGSEIPVSPLLPNALWVYGFTFSWSLSALTEFLTKKVVKLKKTPLARLVGHLLYPFTLFTRLLLTFLSWPPFYRRDCTPWSAGTDRHPHILTSAVLWHCSTFCSCLVQWLDHFSDTEHIQILSPY